MDYVVSTAFELALLGIAENSTTFRTLRDQMTGTPTIRRIDVDMGAQIWLAPEVRALLNRIQDHGSYEAGGYYLKQFTQYFVDATRILREVKRVLAPGGRALVVVQSSYFKDVPVDLPRLWAEMGIAEGMRTCDGPSFPVRRVLSDINPRSFRGRTYREAVVSMELRE